MVLAIWIGVLHITLGRILGLVNARMFHRGKHATKAAIANLGWLGTMWGILLMIWAFYAIPLMPDLTGLPVVAMGLNAAALLGAVLLVAGILGIAQENPLELVEPRQSSATYYHTPVSWRWAYPQSLSRWWSTTSRSA